MCFISREGTADYFCCLRYMSSLALISYILLLTSYSSTIYVNASCTVGCPLSVLSSFSCHSISCASLLPSLAYCSIANQYIASLLSIIINILYFFNSLCKSAWSVVRCFKIVCLLCAFDKVVKLIECALNDALALTLVHRCQ